MRNNALAKLDRARTRLATATTLDEVKRIRDMAETAKEYARKAKLGLEAQNHAAEIALEAARKAGAILKQLQKTRPQSAAKVAGDSEYRKTLKDTGTPERTARYWQRLAEVTEFIAQQYFAKVRKAEKGEITAAGLLRAGDKQGRVVASFHPYDPDPERARRQLLEEGVWNNLSIETLGRMFDIRSLGARFGAPPFSILDLKQSYWSSRQRAWKALGISGEAGRGDEHEAVHNDRILNFDSETNISVFNPALTETIYQWFAPEGGHILDPFAGGSTRGVVAAWLGYEYTGIELRPQQIQENREQVEIIARRDGYIPLGFHNRVPTWIEGNSSQLSRYVAGQEFDLIFTCPPYYDLERYTKADDRDLSKCKTYEEFLTQYENVFRQAIKHLKQDRFVVVVVGEIRDRKGWYRNFVGDTVSCFQRLGLHYYNEIIVLDPIGSAALRVGKPFSQFRKVQKTHQNVLVFWKGNDVKQIPKALGVLDELKFVTEDESMTSADAPDKQNATVEATPVILEAQPTVDGIPVVEKVDAPGNYREAFVVRDDLFPGGSKARFLPALIGDAKEIVYGSPWCGGAAVALSAIGKALGRKVTIFYATRKSVKPRQQTVLDNGGRIEWVPMGFMSNVQKKARDYAEKKGALFFPLGFDAPAAKEAFLPCMQSIKEKYGHFDEVWCATGSGMLAKCLAEAFPESRIMAVTVGLQSRWSQCKVPNITFLASGYEYERQCKDAAPFPACPNYERKAWKLCAQQAKGRILFWNVIGD